MAAYLQHLNASLASRETGHPHSVSARVHGHRMLKKPKIREEIDRRIRELRKNSGGLRHSIVRTLAAILNVDPVRIFDDEGRLKSWRSMSAEDRLAVQSVIRKSWDGPQGSGSEINVKLGNRLEAAKIMAKLLGMDQPEEADLTEEMDSARETVKGKLDELASRKGAESVPGQPDGSGSASPSL